METKNALVIDTRSASDFAKAHIPNSWFIGIDGSFAPWVGALINDLNQPILFVADEGKEEEVVTRMARVGYDNTIGFLKGGIHSWHSAGMEVATLDEMTATEFAQNFRPDAMNLMDVRKNSEFNSEHLLHAENHPLDFIFSEMSTLDKDKTYFIHCAGGYRSVIACSILISRGYSNMVNLKGGFNELKETALPKSDYICPTTML